MDVFALRNRVVGDYADYVRSFFDIRDERIRALVDAELAAGSLWPEPLLQLNPVYERGSSVEDLVRQGLLDARCADVFRTGKEKDGIGQRLNLHRHQADAVAAAKRGRNYVLTTGTRSYRTKATILVLLDEMSR